MFPYCTFKCNKECGKEVCHNSYLKDSDLIEISDSEIVNRYINNPITEAIVMQGLEPFDSFQDLTMLVVKFSLKCSDDIVIYTGYNEDEIQDKIANLKQLVHNNNLIIKFGRFIPDRPSKFDELLGVTLQSDNQYSKII